MMYQIIRSVFFKFDPEKVHGFVMKCLKLICSIPGGKKILFKIFQPHFPGTAIPVLQKGNYKISFPNPVGLGAGFDKNAEYLNELEALGFGFVEIGTVTPLAQPGNDKPRVFRLPQDKALINRMGFNNEGVEIIAKRVHKYNKENPGSKMVVCGNIGKNKVTPNEEAWSDYEKSFLALHSYVDYFVVNVSSPNTPGLRALQEKDSLRKILTNLQEKQSGFEIQKPILLKIAPDLTWSQIDDVIDLCMEIKLDGVVATNTTINREGLSTSSSRIEEIGAGGLSGLPVRKKSTEVVQYIYNKTKGALFIVASGGIFTTADAQEKIKAGASLVQVWTGFIYEGPTIVKKICKDLLM